MIFRFYYEQRGDHVHMRIFSGKKEFTLGKAGYLTMRSDEFIQFKERGFLVGFEFRPEAPVTISSTNPPEKKP